MKFLLKSKYTNKIGDTRNHIDQSKFQEKYIYV